jgi:chromosome segregation ATPase
LLCPSAALREKRKQQETEVVASTTRISSASATSTTARRSSLEQGSASRLLNPSNASTAGTLVGAKKAVESSLTRGLVPAATRSAGLSTGVAKSGIITSSPAKAIARPAKVTATLSTPSPVVTVDDQPQDFMDGAVDSGAALTSLEQLGNDSLPESHTSLDQNDGDKNQSGFRLDYEQLLSRFESSKSEWEAEINQLQAVLAAQSSESEQHIQELQEQVAKLHVDLQISTADLEKVGGLQSHREAELEKEVAALKSQQSGFAKSASSFENDAVIAAGKRCSELSAKIAELEAQVSELSDTLEMVSLDKEQLQLEKEVLEDTNQKLSSDLDAALDSQLASPVVVGDESSSADVEQLSKENFNLKEALKRLHAMNKEETERLKEQLSECSVNKAEHEELVSEVLELRGKVAIQDEHLHELQETVDATSEYEGIIENLTEKNLEQSRVIAELKAAIADFESEVELSEELDRQQRQEIDRLRKDLDSLQVTFNDFEYKNKGVKDRLEDSKKIEEKFKR